MMIEQNTHENEIKATENIVRLAILDMLFPYYDDTVLNDKERKLQHVVSVALSSYFSNPNERNGNTIDNSIKDCIIKCQPGQVRMNIVLRNLEDARIFTDAALTWYNIVYSDSKNPEQMEIMTTLVDAMLNRSSKDTFWQMANYFIHSERLKDMKLVTYNECIDCFWAMAVLAGDKELQGQMEAAYKEKDNWTASDWKALGKSDRVKVQIERAIKEQPKEPKESHEAIDLGLPSGTLWASCNIGSRSPKNSGDYFAWGELETKCNYDTDNYKWCKGSWNNMTKYCTNSEYGEVDGKTLLDPEDDIARSMWGGVWRIPTLDEVKELFSNCSSHWTKIDYMYGLMFTGPNGNTLFLPAGGSRSPISEMTGLTDIGYEGDYWLSSVDESIPYKAHAFTFTQFYKNNDVPRPRYDGLSVRPVRSAN